MAETVKKIKAPANPRNTATRETTAAAASGDGAAAQNSTRRIHVARSQPSHDQISELARKYWADRGYTDGHQEEDWFRAEQELRAKAS